MTPDGKHYIINGQKMWITNAGFADVFIVFAQVDGDKFTGFIIEKDTEGLSLAAEEKKAWNQRILQPDKCFLKMLKCLLKMCLEKLAKGI